MYPLYFIAKHNIKKHKGDALILFFLIFLAGVMLFSSLSFLLTNSRIIDDVAEKWNNADYILFANEKEVEAAEKIVRSHPDTESVSIDKLVCWTTKYTVNDASRKDAASFQFLFSDSSIERTINRFPESCMNLKDGEIIVPYYLSYQFKVGDTIHMFSNGLDESFTIKGFLENVYFANPVNMSMYYCLLSQNDYARLTAIVPDFDNFSLVMSTTKEGTDPDTYAKELHDMYGEDVSSFDLTLTLSKSGAGLITLMSSAIILIFSLLLVGLILIIMSFSIKNFIEMNMQNIGILQANGYKAGSLRMACVLEETLLSIFATALSLIVGVFLSRFLSNIQGSLMGLRGFSGVCIPAVILTMLILPFLVFIGTLFSSRAYKKTSILEAIRSGISNHNFKKNHFPIEKSSLPLSINLAGKGILGEKKKSFLILIVITCLSFATSYGFMLYQNFGQNSQTMLTMIGFETGEFWVTSTDAEAFYEKYKDDEALDHVQFYSTFSGTPCAHLDKIVTLELEAYSDMDMLEYNDLIEGHRVQTANEIVLNYPQAVALDAKVGDVIEVTVNKVTLDFTVCGIDQKIHQAGRVAVINGEGAKRFDPDFKYSTTICYLKDSTQTETIMTRWEKENPNCSFALTKDLLSSTLETTTSAFFALSILFICLTIFVVVLAEILLIRAKVIRERSNYGVSKALGYTSSELILQTMLSHIPVILIGIILGFLLHIASSQTIMSAMLSIFGLHKANLGTSPIWYVVTLAIIMISALAASFFSSKHIAKLDPVAILKEE